jgi:hypothetical protein
MQLASSSGPKDLSPLCLLAMVMTAIFIAFSFEHEPHIMGMTASMPLGAIDIRVRSTLRACILEWVKPQECVNHISWL